MEPGCGKERDGGRVEPGCRDGRRLRRRGEGWRGSRLRAAIRLATAKYAGAGLGSAAQAACGTLRGIASSPILVGNDLEGATARRTVTPPQAVRMVRTGVWQVLDVDRTGRIRTLRHGSSGEVRGVVDS